MDDAVRSEIATLLGMKAAEILDVDEDNGEWVVTSHDQTVTRIPAPHSLGRKHVPGGKRG